MKVKNTRLDALNLKQSSLTLKKGLQFEYSEMPALQTPVIPNIQLYSTLPLALNNLGTKPSKQLWSCHFYFPNIRLQTFLNGQAQMGEGWFVIKSRGRKKCNFLCEYVKVNNVKYWQRKLWWRQELNCWHQRSFLYLFDWSLEKQIKQEETENIWKKIEK